MWQEFRYLEPVVALFIKNSCIGDFHDIGLAFNENLDHPKILSLKLYGCM